MCVRVRVRGQITEVERWATVYYMYVRVLGEGVRGFGRKGEGARSVRRVMYGRVFVCDYKYMCVCGRVMTGRKDEGTRGREFF